MNHELPTDCSSYIRKLSAETQFVAVATTIMQGGRRVAVAVSHNMAKRIARALNLYKPNERGY